MNKHRTTLTRLWMTMATGILIAAVATAASSQAILAPPDLAADDRFGYSIAASGNLLVVGAPGLGYPPTSAGSVYVYQRNESTWTLQARLTPDFGLPGDAFGDQRGDRRQHHRGGSAGRQYIRLRLHLR